MQVKIPLNVEAVEIHKTAVDMVGTTKWYNILGHYLLYRVPHWGKTLTRSFLYNAVYSVSRGQTF